MRAITKLWELRYPKSYKEEAEGVSVAVTAGFERVNEFMNFTPIPGPWSQVCVFFTLSA